MRAKSGLRGLVARLSYTGGPGFFVLTPIERKQDLIERIERAGAVAAGPRLSAWYGSNTASRAMARTSVSGIWPRRPIRRTRCTSARAAIWGRRSWSGCDRAGKSIAC